MTVCLATMAEKSKAIVMVSDKAVTYGEKDSLAPMQNEREKSKADWGHTVVRTHRRRSDFCPSGDRRHRGDIDQPTGPIEVGTGHDECSKGGVQEEARTTRE